MSLTNTNTKVKYSGDNTTTSFAITFDFILNTTECKVILRDETDPDNITETLQVDGVDYNLTGASPPGIPFPTTVEMVVAPTSDQELLVYREMPLTQLLDYIETSVFRAESQEDSLNKLTAITQELSEQLTRAALLSRATDANLPISFPEPKPNEYIGWDTEGDDLRSWTALEILEEAVGLVLLVANNLSDVADPVVSRANIGVGDASDVTHNSLTLAATLTATGNVSGADIIGTGKGDFGAEVEFETFLDTDGVVTPANPAAGRFRLYFKADGNLYKLNDAGLETQVDVGASGANVTLSNLTSPTAVNQDLTMNGTTLKLDNDVSITGRNNADSADINIAKVTISDEIELGANLVPDGDGTRNIGSPTAKWLLGQNLESDSPGVRRLGALTNTWLNVYSGTYSAVGTSGNAGYKVLDAGGNNYGEIAGSSLTPSGTANSTVLKDGASTSGALAVHTINNADADAVATKSLLIETGNKTAGTGDSGDIVAQTGTSVGGIRGIFEFLSRFVRFPNFASDPVTPLTGGAYFNTTDNQLKIYDGTEWAAAGGGTGGGAGSLVWQEVGSSPVLDDEFSSEVYKYQAGLTQDLYTQLEVIPGYEAGDPIAMRINWFSPDSSGTGLIGAEATLIRPGTDAYDSTTNQRLTTNTAVTMTVANQLNTVTLDLTDGSGQINAVAVSPGDVIKIRLLRGTDTGTSDIRFLPGIVGVSYA